LLRRRLRCASACSYSLRFDNRCSLATAPHCGAGHDASASPPPLRFGLLLLAPLRQSVLARHGAALRRRSRRFCVAASAALRLAPTRSASTIGAHSARPRTAAPVTTLPRRRLRCASAC